MGDPTDTLDTSRSGDGEADDLLDDILTDPRLTLAGLFVESWTGFSTQVERRLVADSGLSSQWFGLMLRIGRSPGGRIRLSDLASQTGMSPSGLTRALDRLEEVGYARRVACPSDRRGTFATLTPTGLDTLRSAATGHVRDLDDLLLSVLTPEDQVMLTTLLRKIRDHVNPAAARPPEVVAEPD